MSKIQYKFTIYYFTTKKNRVLEILRWWNKSEIVCTIYKILPK